MILREVPYHELRETFEIAPKGHTREDVFVTTTDNKTHVMRSCALRLLPCMKARLGLSTCPLTERCTEPTATEAVTHGSLGIVDLGASQTVIGQHQV